MKREALKFGELREYFDVVSRVSICMKETLNYRNYNFMSEVPHDYDDMYVYGFGMIDSEFTDIVSGEEEYMPCVEFMLSDKPREKADA